MMKARQKYWPAMNTGPLVRLLKEVFPDGILLATLSERTGYSPQSLSATFRVDNMHLSKAESIAHSLGYTLRLEYKYEGTYPKDSVYIPSGKAGNLYGLEEFMQRMNRSVNFIAASAGYRGEALKAALEKGDMMIATLNKIACSIGLHISWLFEKEVRDE